VHLTNAKTHQIVSEEQGRRDVLALKWKIFEWTLEHRKVLPKQVVDYIRKKMDLTIKGPFGYIYLLYKLHKDPVSKMPICSDRGSLPRALGQYVDEQLQTIVQARETYIKDSFSFKSEISKLKLPPNASSFTYDAISMYTNIDTDDCIARILKYLKLPSTKKRFMHYSVSALLEALVIVMKNNSMRFGDILVKQLIGIAMGMSPAPTIANLYVAIHKQLKILKP